MPATSIASIIGTATGGGSCSGRVPRGARLAVALAGLVGTSGRTPPIGAIGMVYLYFTPVYTALYIQLYIRVYIQPLFSRRYALRVQLYISEAIPIKP